MDSPVSHRISVPRGTQGHNESLSAFAYGGLTRSASAFQQLSASPQISHSLNPLQQVLSCLTTPHLQRLQPIAQVWFGLLPLRSPLLREYSLFLAVLRCFSSRRAPRLAYRFSQRYAGIACVGSPIRVPPDHRSMTAPRGFSQPSTPFFGL